MRTGCRLGCDDEVNLSGNWRLFCWLECPPVLVTLQCLMVFSPEPSCWVASGMCHIKSFLALFLLWTAGNFVKLMGTSQNVFKCNKIVLKLIVLCWGVYLCLWELLFSSFVVMSLSGLGIEAILLASYKLLSWVGEDTFLFCFLEEFGKPVVSNSFISIHFAPKQDEGIWCQSKAFLSAHEVWFCLLTSPSRIFSLAIKNLVSPNPSNPSGLEQTFFWTWVKHTGQFLENPHVFGIVL